MPVNTILQFRLLFIVTIGFLSVSLARAQTPAPTAEVPVEEVDNVTDSGEEAVDGTPTPSAAPAIAAYTVEQLDEVLGEVQGRVQTAEEQGDSESPVAPDIVTALRDLENSIQRRLTTMNRLEESRAALDAAKSLPEAPANGDSGPDGADAPQAFLELEGRRDQLAAFRREAETDTLAVGTAEALLGQAGERVQRAEQRRREAEDGLAAGGAAAAGGGAVQIEIARLNERQAKHDRANAATQLEIAKIEKEISDKQVAETEALVAAAQGTVFLTRNELEEKFGELDVREEQANKQLGELRGTDTANQTRVANAEQRLQQAPDAEINTIREELATRQAFAQASSRGIEVLQQRIDNIAKSRMLWERRYLLSRGAEAMELAQWENETTTLIEEIAKRRTEIERRLQDLRTSQLELDNRIGTLEGSNGIKGQLESRQNALKNREDHLGAYLSSLLEIDKLATRLLGDVQRERGVDSWQAAIAQLRIAADGVWKREVFVIDGRAFRIGALTRSGLLFAFCLGFTLIVRWILRRTIIAKLRQSVEKTQLGLDDALLAIVRKTRPSIVFVLACYVAMRTLPLSERLAGWLDSAAFFLVLFQVATWGAVALQNSIDRAVRRRSTEDPESVSAYGVIAFFGRVAIWSVALLLFLDSIESVEITTLIAGLGVGGIAIAFALQNILGDVFCSIAILLDKPFVVGDFIIVGDMLGEVEQIGIKTTRIRSLGGEQIIFSNADLLASRIRNYKRMYERRVLFGLGIVYESTEEQIEAVPKLIREIIEDMPGARFDRAHFKGYGDFALLYEVVFYVLGPDYNQYMDIQQEINLRIFRGFKELGISFAYPTQELILRGFPKQGGGSMAGLGGE